jgi:hypothetical protein
MVKKFLSSGHVEWCYSVHGFQVLLTAFLWYIYYLFFLLPSSWISSSGSIVSDYGLDDQVIEVRSPTGTEDFSSSPCIQTGSGAHPASYPMGTPASYPVGTGDPFPGGKVQLGHDADHSPPSSAKVKNELDLYLLSPHAPPWRVAGHLYLFMNFIIIICSFIIIFAVAPVIVDCNNLNSLFS